MARKTSTVPAVRLIPSTTSFDFLEGAFAAAQRARKIGIGITMFAVVTLTLLALAGLGGLLEKRAAEALLTQTRASNATALRELAKIDNAGGVGAAAISAHVSERQRALKSAIGEEIDVATLVGSLRATAPNGVTITSVSFLEAGAEPTTSSTATMTPVPTPPAPASPSTAGGSGDAAAESSGTVTIQGTVTSFALIGTWAHTVSTIPGMSQVTPTWSGGGGAISTTLTASVTESGLTQRARALKAEEGN